MEVIFLMSLFAAILAASNGTMPFKDQCLYWHNYFRTLHQVPNVTWSMSLQKEAEDWVKYLAENDKFHHSQKNPGNLYLSVYKPREYCSDAIWWFHWEEKFYNYSNPRYVKAAGHFTQVLWKNSKEIGAAWAIRKDNKLVISIKYHPGGNYVGYFKKNIRRPTAALLGPGWPRAPPKFARCPAAAILTPEPTTAPTTAQASTPDMGGNTDLNVSPSTTQASTPDMGGNTDLNVSPSTTQASTTDMGGNTDLNASPSTTQASTPDMGGTMPFQHQCLYWHNYFRTLHQVPLVTWSISLQREAEDWVKYLADNNKFETSKNNSGNLYMSVYRPREYCSEAVWWFHRQEKYYDFTNPRYVKAASNFTQMVWKDVKQIGAAWAFRKDNRLVVVIKYTPESKEDGNYEENVFLPIAETLGPEWTRNPPEYARCPRENIPTLPPTNATTNATKPHVKGAARKTGSGLELFIASVIFAGLFS